MGDDNELFELLKPTLRYEYLHAQIADRIQGIIASDQIHPGTRLPSERDLAQLLGVNRATVREAMCLLQQRGLVEMKVGSGTFIIAMPSSNVSDSIERLVVVGSCSDEDLVRLREILEPEVAALAAQHATPAHLAKLSEFVDQIETAFANRDSKLCALADMSFHELLAEASGNSLIIAIIRGVANVIRQWIQARAEVQWTQEGVRTHRPVLDAVGARDPDRAREAMRAHMRTIRPTLTELRKNPVRRQLDNISISLFPTAEERAVSTDGS